MHKVCQTIINSYCCILIYLIVMILQRVKSEPTCFENMDQLFSANSTAVVHHHTPEYYSANIQFPKSFPHVAQVKSRNKNKCVGVIISRRFILSSAICLKSPGNPATSVWLGDIPRRNATKEYRQSNTYEIMEIILHPDYKEGSFFRDIGLAKLKRPIEFTSRRYPACLESRSSNANSVDYTVEEDSDRGLILSNFGQIQENVVVPVYETCNDYFEMMDVLEREQFCATVRENCIYSTGCPIQRKHDTLRKIFTVEGILNLRRDCKISGSQVVFTRVSYFMDWIKKEVNFNHSEPV